jgi:hypothetical protein
MLECFHFIYLYILILFLALHVYEMFASTKLCDHGITFGCITVKVFDTRVILAIKFSVDLGTPNKKTCYTPANH